MPLICRYGKKVFKIWTHTTKVITTFSQSYPNIGHASEWGAYQLLTLSVQYLTLNNISVLDSLQF